MGSDLSGELLVDGGMNQLTTAKRAEIIKLTHWETLSRNLKRRHLTESQRAMVAARLANLDRGKPVLNGPIGPLTQPEAAKRLNIGTRTVKRAKVVLDHGVPELVKAVEDRRGQARTGPA